MTPTPEPHAPDPAAPAIEGEELIQERHDFMERFARLVCEKAVQRIRAEAAEANLIALAKMYGDACGELQRLRHLMVEHIVIEVVEDEEAGRELLAAVQVVSEARTAAESEAAQLRQIISECATAIGNGAAVGPECTLEFMSWLPKEIASVTTKLREQLRESALQHIARDMGDEQDATTISHLSARVRELEEALRPFSEAADDLDESDHGNGHLWEAPAAMSLTAGDLRRARSALSSSKTEKRDV